MNHEDALRLSKFKEMRQLQYEKRVLIIHLPRWLARIRRFFTGYGPESWNYHASVEDET